MTAKAIYCKFQPLLPSEEEELVLIFDPNEAKPTKHGNISFTVKAVVFYNEKTKEVKRLLTGESLIPFSNIDSEIKVCTKAVFWKVNRALTLQGIVIKPPEIYYPKERLKMISIKYCPTRSFSHLTKKLTKEILEKIPKE